MITRTDVQADMVHGLLNRAGAPRLTSEVIREEWRVDDGPWQDGEPSDDAFDLDHGLRSIDKRITSRRRYLTVAERLDWLAAQTTPTTDEVPDARRHRP